MTRSTVFEVDVVSKQELFNSWENGCLDTERHVS